MDARKAITIVTRRNAALEALYRRYQAMLCAYVRKSFGAGPPDPEDVTHAAFTRFATLENPESIHNPPAYLKRIAANIVYETHRRAGRTARAHHDVQILQAENADLSPEDVLSSKEDLDRLNAIIASLKPKYRIALLLHRVDGLSFVEIAREMGISQSGARLLVDTALAQCAQGMRKGEQA